MEVSQRELLAHLQSLEGERHPLASPGRLAAAQAYITARWRSWGLSVSQQAFSYEGRRVVNLIARPAAAAEGPRLILGAHVDTVEGTPGADDNASGLAALLELSRLAAAGRWRTPVELVVFDLEEEGMIGSGHYAAALRQQRVPVRGMLSLEMLGFTESQGLQRYPFFLRGRYPAAGTYIGLAANWRSRGLLKTVASAMRGVPGLPVETILLPGNGWLFPEARLSDHAPFWDAGFPALLITDTAMFRNPHYHRPTDTVATLDLGFLAKVTEGLAAAIASLSPDQI